MLTRNSSGLAGRYLLQHFLAFPIPESISGPMPSSFRSEDLVGCNLLFRTTKEGGACLLNAWPRRRMPKPRTDPSSAFVKVGDGNAAFTCLQEY